jgi:hypothetical protein
MPFRPDCVRMLIRATKRHGRPPLYEIYGDLILARLMPSGAVHTNRRLFTEGYLQKAIYTTLNTRPGSRKNIVRHKCVHDHHRRANLSRHRSQLRHLCPSGIRAGCQTVVARWLGCLTLASQIVAARLQSSTKCPRVHRRGLTNFTKRGRLPLPRARPHQLGESHCGVGGPGDGLIAFGATMYRCPLPS